MFGRKPSDESADEPKPESFFQRLRKKINRGPILSYDLANLLPGRKIDAALLEEIETRLLMGDVGVDATEALMSDLHRKVARKELDDIDALFAALRQHFDDDVLVGTGTQYGIDGRQTPVEPDVHDAAPHRDHHARIRRTRSIVHGCSIRSARRPCTRRIAILPQPRTLGQS